MNHKRAHEAQTPSSAAGTANLTLEREKPGEPVVKFEHVRLAFDDKVVLKDTFAKASLPSEIEVYEGAAHGWCPPDSGVYNEPQAEKAWSRLLALYGRGLA